MDRILEVQDLRVYYDLPHGTVRAVDGISLDVYRGELLGVAGESGSGKSTLALAIAGLLRPPARVVSGRILFDGVDILRLSNDELRRIRGKRIGVIFQDPNTYLNPIHTSGFQVAEVFEAHRGGPVRRYLDEVARLFKLVRIADPERRLHAYPHQLSGGMKQRILIAMSIAEKPDVIVADEPTSALDVTIQSEIMELLNNIRKEMGTSVVMITHDLALLIEVADRVAVMYAGKLVEVSSLSELVKDPLHPYTKLLLSVLRYERKKRLTVIPGSIPSLIDPPPGCRFYPRCPYALSECSKVEPRMVDLGGRLVACHLAGGKA